MEKLNLLIPELAESSQNAWAEFVKLTSNDLHLYICYFLHDAEHAADILQEVYLMFLLNISIFSKLCKEEPAEIATKKIYLWLYKTSKNKSLNVIKKKKNGIIANISQYQKKYAKQVSMPSNFLEKKESNELIRYELALLSEKQQNLLTLKYFHDKSNAEIASEIKCGINSVPILLNRALENLKNKLEKDGLTLSIAFIGESLSNKAMCVDLPANLLPTIFNCYQSTSTSGLIIKSIFIKGMPLKSLYALILSFIIITSYFWFTKKPPNNILKNYISRPAQENGQKNEKIEPFVSADQNVAPQIAGSIWSPNYDNKGNVIAGDWASLPLYTWLYANVPAMISVVEQPPYSSFTGEDGIMDAWSGAAWDHITQKMYFHGGGHGDTSACETGVYSLDVAKLAFARVRNRNSLSSLQSWDAVSKTISGIEHHDARNVPLLDGMPGAIHTYHALVWIPPSIMGNTSGGVFLPGNAKAVLNLDTNNLTTCHYNNLASDFNTWNDTAMFLDGDTIYGQDSSFWHRTFKLNTTQATTYSPTSFGTFVPRAIAHKIAMEGGGLWSCLRERREEVSFTQAAGFSRMRYGQAIDAAASSWAPYQDAIILTSEDGSHTDFNTANLSQNGNVALDGMFSSCGVVYDHLTQTIYVQGNKVGSQLYKITGLSGNTWSTKKIPGTGALELCIRGTYGRMRLATFGGTKVIIRVSSVRSKPQVMRID